MKKTFILCSLLIAICTCAFAQTLASGWYTISVSMGNIVNVDAAGRAGTYTRANTFHEWTYTKQ